MKSIASALWKVIDTLARAVISLIARVSPKLGEKCLNLWNDTSFVTYVFVGLLTTIVNVIAFWFGTHIHHLDILSGNCFAWIVAVSFGYWANKTIVFKTHSDSLQALLTECISFFAMRLVSLGVESVILKVTVEILHLPDMIMKVITNFVVVILNYVFSKVFIFKKK